MTGEYRNDARFMDLIRPIIGHPEYERQKTMRHHHGSIYEHSLDVAWASYRIGLRLGLRVDELVKGALLHDFFLYDRRDETNPVKFHFYRHPKKSFENAWKWFGPLTECEAEIIQLHMWPVAPRFPACPETFVVAAVDKVLALRELCREAVSRFTLRWEEG